MHVPFKSGYAALIEQGRKTATTRTRRYGIPGQAVTSTAGDLLLVAVVKMPLRLVRDYWYEAEGFETPSEFVAAWKSVHPRKQFDPKQLVWLHVFVTLERARKGWTG